MSITGPGKETLEPIGRFCLVSKHSFQWFREILGDWPVGQDHEGEVGFGGKQTSTVGPLCEEEQGEHWLRPLKCQNLMSHRIYAHVFRFPFMLYFEA